MEDRIQIYATPRHYEREKKNLENDDLSAKTKQLIRDWHEHLFATDSGELRVAKLSSQLRKIAKDLNAALDKLTFRDVERLVALYKRDKFWTEATKADYKRCLKQFLIWYEDQDPRIESDSPDERKEARDLYKYLRKHVRIAYNRDKIDYNTIITDQDLQELLDGCMPKERAFLSALHEGGFRAGEILGLRIRDLEIKNDQIDFHVNGKTGRRVVPLQRCMASIMHWLETHPGRHEATSPLWVSDSPANKGAPLKHRGAQKIIDRAAKRTKFKKQHNLHWFRHSRATINGEFMTEAMLCQFMGWRIGSKMPRTYLHTGRQQLENVVRRMNGFEPQELISTRPKRCSICSLINEASRRYCGRCGRPLDTKTANEEKDALEMAFELLKQVMADPEKRARFEEFKKARAGG